MVSIRSILKFSSAVGIVVFLLFFIPLGLGYYYNEDINQSFYFIF